MSFKYILVPFRWHTMKNNANLACLFLVASAGGGDTSTTTGVGGGNDGDDDEEPSQTPLNSPGPAVYIINKRPPPEANENQQEGDVSAPSTIPLRFFSY